MNSIWKKLGLQIARTETELLPETRLAEQSYRWDTRVKSQYLNKGISTLLLCLFALLQYCICSSWTLLLGLNTLISVQCLEICILDLARSKSGNCCNNFMRFLRCALTKFTMHGITKFTMHGKSHVMCTLRLKLCNLSYMSKTRSTCSRSRMMQGGRSLFPLRQKVLFLLMYPASIWIYIYILQDKHLRVSVVLSKASYSIVCSFVAKEYLFSIMRLYKMPTSYYLLCVEITVFCVIKGQFC